MKKKRSTLEAVRGVKTNVSHLISQVRQGQQWKRKYKALKLELSRTKLIFADELMRIQQEKTKKIVSKDNHLNELFEIFNASPSVRHDALIMSKKLEKCEELMGKRSKTVAVCVLHLCLKPYVDRNIISQKAKLSLPTLSRNTKIIQNYLKS
jgi:hypothetical protein